VILPKERGEKGSIEDPRRDPSPILPAEREGRIHLVSRVREHCKGGKGGNTTNWPIHSVYTGKTRLVLQTQESRKKRETKEVRWGEHRRREGGKREARERADPTVEIFHEM